MEREQYQVSDGGIITMKGGQSYLLVKERVSWMLHDFPRSQIITEPVTITEAWAVIRADVRVIDEHGAVVREGTGIAQEWRSTFADHVEKAETAAVGRACAHIGYGTQHLDEGQIVDTPRTAPAHINPGGGAPNWGPRPAGDPALANDPPAPRAKVAKASSGASSEAPSGTSGKPTQAQTKFLSDLGKQTGVSPKMVEDSSWYAWHNGDEGWGGLGALTRDECSTLIDWLVDLRAKQGEGGDPPIDLMQYLTERTAAGQRS